jgi:hypothetical protein
MKTPKVKKYTLEYIFVASPKLLYHYISTEPGMSEWFAPKVNYKDNIFHFAWDDTEQKAEIELKKENEFIRYKWLGEDAGNYFEFKINTESISNEITLIVTDFAAEEDMKYSQMAWDSAIKKLLRIIGAKLISGLE